MITAEMLVQKLEDRFYRRSSPLELVYWAKSLIFNHFQGKPIATGENANLVEAIVLRVSNSSTNYRVFLFDKELQQHLLSLGKKCEKPNEALYGFNLIVSGHKARLFEVLGDKLTKYIVETREHGPTILISCEGLTEEQIHELAACLRDFDYVLSLRDSSA
ncbi:MAG: hypothetical protein RMM17_12505 [Acidobacteriota bacterium]|nr:hypothetical protein [Blastocatellia bacterium]MDW8413492.1 hypothetical protein [Acidobacteriota bacterium]